MSQGDSRVLNSSPSSTDPDPGYVVGVLDLGRGYHHSVQSSSLSLDRRTSDSSVSTESFEYPAGRMDFDDGDSQDIQHAPIRRETSIFIGGPNESANQESLSDRSLTTCPRCDQNLYGRTQRQHEAEGCVAVPIPRPSHAVPQTTPFFPGSPPLPEYMVQAMVHSRHRVAPAQIPDFSKHKSPATAPRSLLSQSDTPLGAGHDFIGEGVDVDVVPSSSDPDAPFLPPGLGDIPC
jgi:hypothetical protein